MSQPLEEERPSTPTATALDGVVLQATRELLWIETAADARTAALRLVADLGGVVVPADAAGTDALPIDLSFGVEDPVLPSAQLDSAERLGLSRHLPAFIRDAHRAVELAARTRRLVKDADFDALTGLPNRRVMGRALGRLRTGDTLIMLDLDHFKQLNDQMGHLEGDAVLRSLGQTITDTIRARDLASRFGGEEFLIVLNEPMESDGVEAFLERLRAKWEQMRPHPVTFSAGIARVEGDGGDVVGRADAAMYAAKRAGRNRWSWSQTAGPTVASTSLHDDAQRASKPAATFVAHSLLRVPSGGRPESLAAFADRLGQVDDRPGFQRLELWTDRSDTTSLVMVSWWDDEDAFKAYLTSNDPHDSHARIADGEMRPHPERFTSYDLFAR